MSFPKLSTPKKGGKQKIDDIYSDDSEEPIEHKGKKKEKDSDDMSYDSDFVTPKKKKLRSSLLDAKVSESDSEVDRRKKKAKGSVSLMFCIQNGLNDPEDLICVV